MEIFAGGVNGAAWPIAQVYDGDSRSEANAEFIVNACNNHEKFVQLAQMVAGRMYDDGVGHAAVQTAEELLNELGVEYYSKTLKGLDKQ